MYDVGPVRRTCTAYMCDECLHYHTCTQYTCSAYMYAVHVRQCKHRFTVLINFVVGLHMILVNVEWQVGLLKVSRFSIGWFVLAARLVRAQKDFCTSMGQTQ